MPTKLSSTCKPHATSPDHEFSGWPPGIKYIIGNEGCERFSFYGMKAILYVYLAMVYTQIGLGDKLAGDTATAHVHIFVAATYGFSLLGAVLAEKLLGKYQTIFWLSIVYCLGHGTLSLFEGNLPGTYLGLGLIAVGAGGIKPCVSAHVGDQFGRGNWFRLQRIYQIFYFIINFGSFFSTLLIPIIKQQFGYSVAFAIPGILMFIATIFFWMGRNVFVHVPSSPGGKLGLFDALIGCVISAALLVPLLLWEMMGPELWLPISAACVAVGYGLFRVRQGVAEDDGFLAVLLLSLRSWLSGKNKTGPSEEGVNAGKYERHWFFGAAARRYGEEAAEGPAAVFRIVLIFIFVSVFWALFDQHASTWIRQAGMMDREVTLPFFGTLTLLPEQISALNPVMVMILIPFVGFVLYPALERFGFEMRPLRRMTIGMFITALAYVAVALVQSEIAAGAVMDDGLKYFPYVVVTPEPTVNVFWQVVPYLLLTLGEVMVSITGLEFAYSQAPRRMKSIIMGFWLLTVTLGNVLVAFIVDVLPQLTLTNFFWLFAALMAAAGVFFGILSATTYTYKDYTQE